MRTSGNRTRGDRKLKGDWKKMHMMLEINNEKTEKTETEKNVHRETRPFFVRGDIPGRPTTPSFVLDVAGFVS